MTDIYYMGKKKKPVKKKKTKTDGYDLKCQLKNCNAKFKTADSLILHEKCHLVTKDDGEIESKLKEGQFGCPSCVKRYVNNYY